VNLIADDIDFDADNIEGAITALRNGRDWEIDAMDADRQAVEREAMGAHDAGF
jgi:hypothetical protein